MASDDAITSTRAPEAETTAGRVRGIQRPGSAAFLGIPFAAPPIGALRFAAPASPARWEGVRDATAYGPTPQRRPFGVITTIPEPSIPGDATLNVNVFTPAPGDRDALLPVLVWIHGGGFIAGSPASPWYDGAAFNRDGVVTVSVSYRLGFDGWGWIDGAPANRGLLDQVAALEWVRSNIRQFGGDPDRVTIGGQSAGGGGVLALMASPLADGLFRRAIVESGTLPLATPGDAHAVTRCLADLLGVGVDLASWRTVHPAVIVDRERDVTDMVTPTAGADATPSAVVASMQNGARPFLDLAYGPVIDGESLFPIAERLAAGASPTPLLIGTTAHEFGFPSTAPAGPVVGALRAGGASARAIDDLEADLARIGPAFATSVLVTGGAFRVPLLRVTDARSAGGQGERTWRYDFRLRSAVSGTAGHCLDVPFVWDLLGARGVADVLGATPPQGLADTMHAAWVGFVADGTAPWPSIADAPTGAMTFDEESGYNQRGYLLERDLLQHAS